MALPRHLNSPTAHKELFDGVNDKIDSEIAEVIDLIDKIDVEPASLISSNSGNVLRTGTDDKLYVPEQSGGGGGVDPADLVSMNDDNYLTLGSDAKLYVPTPEIPDVNPTNLISSNTGNTLRTGTDDKLYVPVPEVEIDPAELISSDAGNTIVTGTDNGLFSPPVVIPPIPDKFSDLEDTPANYGTAGQVATSSGSAVVWSDLPEIPDPPTAGEYLSTDEGNLIGLGTDDKLYIDEGVVQVEVRHHANLEFLGPDENVRFFIPASCTKAHIEAGSIAGDQAAVYPNILVELTSTYATVEMQALDVGLNETTLTNQGGKHVTATVISGWPENVGRLSLDMVFV